MSWFKQGYQKIMKSEKDGKKEITETVNSQDRTVEAVTETSVESVEIPLVSSRVRSVKDFKQLYMFEPTKAVPALKIFSARNETTFKTVIRKAMLLSNVV